MRGFRIFVTPLRGASATWQSFIKKQNSGFTLIEVMISLAIVGGLLITLLYTLSYNLGINERQFAVTNITNLAKEKIEEMEESPQENKGRFPEPYDTLNYETKVKDSPFNGMSEIIVVVSNEKESITLSELVRKQI
ncbi:MAG: type II secretion system protein [Syntrophales bacterium]|jgi:prepilin-type N-terminal cleavage/methylation domain-containing protein